QLLVAVVITVGLILLATAEWRGPQNVDVGAATVPGHSLVATGSFWVDEPPPGNPWFIEQEGRYISDRPVGLMTVAALFYVAWPATSSTVPPTVGAVLVALGVVVVVVRTAATLTDERRLPVATGAVIALGTSVWSISAAQLWPHGPAQLALAGSVLLVARQRPGLGGLAAGLAVTIRPITAVGIAVFGVWTFGRRRPRELIMFSITSALGLGAVVAWNWITFGSPSITGGYSTVFLDRVVSPEPIAAIGRILALWLSPTNGLLLWSPFLIVLLAFVPTALRSASSWVVGGFLGGIAYMVVHGISNRASGGLPFGYRYPLEALVLMTPAFVLAYQRFATTHRRLMPAFVALLILAIVLQFFLAVTLTCVPIVGSSEVICRLLD
ncbi:MAG: hypothetical protein OEM97_02425, partial [Acidimicrobiia bacterium]|nr:hypothetical protein [Acidimicrobiia bacterium]